MRVVIVDDSTIFRKVVRDTLAQCQGVEVVAVASDGKSALKAIEHFKPDLITLDHEMPVMNGIEVLRTLKGQQDRPEVIMLSAMTDMGALTTTQALRLGAFDFVLKPEQSSMEASCVQLRRDLLPKVRVLQERLRKKADGQATDQSESKIFESTPQTHRCIEPYEAKVVGIGVSTGGPAALSELLPKLPADLAVPILIVQHMPAMFTHSLASDLDRICKIKVCEAKDGQDILPGTAYIAPGGKQMKVVNQNDQKRISVTDDQPERNCKPSVDYLFRSMASVYGREVLALVMTGMGDDGTLGCRYLKRNGCMTVAQSEESCIVFGMPRQIIAAGLADRVIPLNRLHEIIESAGNRKGVTRCR
ncbi:chemotaxis-specific protein-glutamate methyltransferase CheB [bacterium]|nr:chemotaxis-specific protein-glutamate methyltransferase CheB [bacterium]